jgi:hypothetical protein
MSVISQRSSFNESLIASFVIGSHHKDNIERMIQKWEAHLSAKGRRDPNWNVAWAVGAAHFGRIVRSEPRARYPLIRDTARLR